MPLTYGPGYGAAVRRLLGALQRQEPHPLQTEMTGVRAQSERPYQRWAREMGDVPISMGMTPIAPGSVATIAGRLATTVAQTARPAARALEEVFTRGLRNQATRGSLFSAAELKALAREAFTKGAK